MVEVLVQKPVALLLLAPPPGHLIVADPHREILAKDQDNAQFGTNQPPRVLQIWVPATPQPLVLNKQTLIKEAPTIDVACGILSMPLGQIYEVVLTLK